ncbi:hypothetical protein [Flavobacterium sp.]|jgi:hypothetical protein|uniref:hypothetical protein n=1 Tax=Flavobacterium sp. TaxID=239 RepID=UPI0037BF2012
MTVAKKKPVDWEKVERLYRAGVMSLREIATPNGISETAIRKKAKKEGWVRDLQGKIKARSDDLVRKAEVRNQVRTENAESERVLIEATAQAIADVRLSHRKDISRHRTLVQSLLEEVEHQTINRALYEELGEMLRNPDQYGNDRINDLYMKAMATPSRIDSAKKLAEALGKLVALEREAYAMDNSDKTPANPSEDLSDDELGARLLALLTPPTE